MGLNTLNTLVSEGNGLSDKGSQNPEAMSASIRIPLRAEGSLVYHLIVALRPKHWIKNILLFAPLLFAQQFLEWSYLFRTLIGFLAFCMVASSIYLLNDIKDRGEDRNHPTKRLRPIAAGFLSTRLAVSTSIGLILMGLGLSVALGQEFFCVVAAYFILQVLYTFILKDIVILDVFCVAAGFFARVAAGARANEITISYWLIICSTMLSLFLALAKRRHEQVLLGEEGTNHRRTLSEYSPHLLDQMIGVVTATTLISYILYTVSPETVGKYHTHGLVATIPFVLYGILRYLYLVHQKQQGGNPETLLLTDKPLLVSVILWGMTTFLIIYIYK